MKPIILNRDTWIKDLKGPSLSILVAMLFFGSGERGLGPSDLSRHTGYGRPSVYTALQDLRDRGMALNYGTKHRPSWFLTTFAHDFMSDNASHEVTETTVTLEYTPIPVVIDPNVEIIKINPTTTTYKQGVILDDTSMEELQEPDINKAVCDKLIRLGVWKNRARKAAQDSWVTVNRIDAWLKELTPNRGIKNVAAVLMTHLSEHEEPSQVVGSTDRRRYIEGKYAAQIQH